MKRTWFSILLASVLAIGALSGCSQSSPAASESSTPAPESSQTSPAATDLLAAIRDKGEIVVAMEGTWAPWTFHDESDTLVGYDVEVAQKIAEKLGVTATFVEGEWDGLLAGLDAGRYDIMVNGVNITEERSQKYDFSAPYAYDRTAVIVSGDNNDIAVFEDLSGKQTANTISSTYATLAESYGATVTGVDDLNQTFELLLSGRIDATLNAEVTYYDYMKAHPDANIKIAVLNEDATPIAIPMRKGEETAALRTEVDKALDELRAAGELAELSQKYFGSDISSVTREPEDASASSGQPVADATSSAAASGQPAADATSSAAASGQPAADATSSAAASGQPAADATSSAAASGQPTPETAPTAAPAAAQTAAKTPRTMQLRVTGLNQSVVFRLNDSSAARSLYEQLPLSIGVENYASNEKIFYPPEKLDTSDTPLLSSGGAGTLGYYAQWGDVIFFYGSCGSADGLYSLGTVVSGADQIESLSGTIQMDAYTG